MMKDYEEERPLLERKKVLIDTLLYLLESNGREDNNRSTSRSTNISKREIEPQVQTVDVLGIIL